MLTQQIMEFFDQVLTSQSICPGVLGKLLAFVIKTWAKFVKVGQMNILVVKL